MLVFKLNRDPLVFSRTAKNNNHGRGTYGVAGWDISDDGGIDKVPGPGKHCFYGYFPGPLTADIAPTYHRLKPGQRSGSPCIRARPNRPAGPAG